MTTSRPFGGLDLDHADPPAGWSAGSLGLFVLSSGLYWAFIWLASGLPPLASVASKLQARLESESEKT